MWLLFQKNRWNQKRNPKGQNTRSTSSEAKRKKTEHTDVLEDDVTDDEKENSKSCLAVWLDKTEKMYPRVFNLTTVVAMPLFIMICIAMLCGHFLAYLESENELESLHSSMTSFLDSRGQIRELVDSIENSYDKCVGEYFMVYSDVRVNEIFFKSYMDECRERGMDQVNAKVLELDNEAEENLINSLTLNWNTCFVVDETGEKSKLGKQVQAFTGNWFKNYEASYYHHLDGNNENEANEKAIKDARRGINDICSVNSAGGAMFWFTIMTTIGYGNTAPKTRGGRAMVYTAGFFSILVFTALIGAAGYVFLTIADDFLMHMRMRKLTKGMPAIIFWFFILCMWLIVLAGVSRAYDKSKYGYITDSLEDRVWWAFISVTTVGFGDFYIPHDTFQIQDVWYLPLLMLMGFVNMANFLLKVSELIIDAVKSTGITDDESLNYLLRQSRLGVNILELDAKDLDLDRRASSSFD